MGPLRLKKGVIAFRIRLSPGSVIGRLAISAAILSSLCPLSGLPDAVNLRAAVCRPAQAVFSYRFAES